MSERSPSESREELPIPDYDHLPAGSLQHRIRTLPEDGLRRLLDHERAHGDRLQVVRMMEARLQELADGAAPSGGSPAAPAPEAPPAPAGGDKVSPETTGPAMNPPSHGAPENPAQPRSTG